MVFGLVKYTVEKTILRSHSDHRHRRMAPSSPIFRVWGSHKLNSALDENATTLWS
jgi:hypothetical protein